MHLTGENLSFDTDTFFVLSADIVLSLLLTRILFIYCSQWFTIKLPKFEKNKSLKTSVSVSRFL